MGNDIRRFASAKQFAGWLRLVPNNEMSGGRMISSRTPIGINRLTIALRQAANSIGNQAAHPLAPFFKRIAYRKGRNAAITATARKLAVIIWNMITKHQPYLPYDAVTLSEQRKNVQVKNIKKRLFRLNLTEIQMVSLFKKISFPVTWLLVVQKIKNIHSMIYYQYALSHWLTLNHRVFSLDPLRMLGIV